MRKLHFHPCGNFRETYQEELAVFETDFGRLWMMIGLVLLFGVIPWISGPYVLFILNTIGIYAIAAIGLNLLIGFTGQISLGHGGFFGVGAYAAAILSTKAGLSFWLAVPAAAFITAAIGIGFGLPSLRLKHLYLTIATLAGQLIIEYGLVQWEDLTGGAEGIIVSGASLFGFDLDSDRCFFYIIFGCFVLLTWMAVNLVRTKYGRAFIAIRDNDRAAEGMGIPIFIYKLLSFAVSSFYAGFAGGLYAFMVMSITPEPFNLWLSIEYIAMIIIGGLGSITGSVFGAIFIVTLNELLAYVTEFLMNINTSVGIAITIAPLREFVFGLTIVLFIIFEPKGLAEAWRIFRSHFRLWPFSY
ncbi:MAG: branched-chain amino acid ABC transporter permease [Desulfatiglans sp.]|jgi:branched-chain amino acid transport system permease protein|nr:branched-chain amino acid ABC transporter permease [Thermodesulfobacteriota bacterium]MEE4354409.1 branched-chain amino acid ABC transporter permease [Desulfatiglans sp.]